MESIKDAVDLLMKEKLEAMKQSMDDLYEEYRGKTVTEIWVKYMGYVYNLQKDLN